MKICSIALRTTSKDPRVGQVLEFSAFIEDTENIVPLHQLPEFSVRIRSDVVVGDPACLADLASELRQLNDKKSVRPEDLGDQFWKWITKQYSTDENCASYPHEITIIGCDFAGTELPFLTRIPDFFTWVKFNRFFLDIPTLMFSMTEGFVHHKEYPSYVHMGTTIARKHIELFRKVKDYGQELQKTKKYTYHNECYD